MGFLKIPFRGKKTKSKRQPPKKQVSKEPLEAKVAAGEKELHREPKKADASKLKIDGTTTAETKLPPKKKVSRVAWQVLKEPHVTEKATSLAGINQYVFKVFPKSNKIQIKRAVEDVYGVNVTKVRIIRVASKKRRLGRIEGRRTGYKKAIVSIKEGQKIEILPR